MAVTRTLPAAMALTALAALLGACSSTSLQEPRSVEPMPGPGSTTARHGPLDPSHPIMPRAGSGRGGYYQDDGPGDNPPADLGRIPDAEVRAEPYSRYANRPYAVFGKTYTPVVNDEPFVQRGVSSWYGKKFHGQRTSSGEIYDMYKMTAAHPTLPIPSYARITNLDNGTSVVVRVNDRGPFHAGRIVDVSYAAALKLGLLVKGSQRVEVERLLPNMQERIATYRRNAVVADPPSEVVTMAVDMPPALAVQSSSSEPEPAPVPAASNVVPAGFYLQLGAFSRADKAADIVAQLAALPDAPSVVEVVRSGALHRVFSGPFPSRADAMLAARAVPAALRLKPIVVTRE